MSTVLHVAEGTAPDEARQPVAENTQRPRACTSAATIRTEGLEKVMEATALNALMRRRLVRIYAAETNPQIRTLLGELADLTRDSDRALAPATALLDRCHAKLALAESSNGEYVCRGESEAQSGRAIGALVGLCLDTLATLARAAEHESARADLHAQFSIHGDDLFAARVTDRMSARQRDAMRREYAAWQAAQA